MLYNKIKWRYKCCVCNGVVQEIMVVILTMLVFLVLSFGFNWFKCKVISTHLLILKLLAIFKTGQLILNDKN